MEMKQELLLPREKVFIGHWVLKLIIIPLVLRVQKNKNPETGYS